MGKNPQPASASVAHHTDWLPLIAVATVTALITASVSLSFIQRRVDAAKYTAEQFDELGPLLMAYGERRHSENFEELIIRDFFHDKRGGIFLDVGANHYERHSNTFYLETALGWSGLAVEPQTHFAADYAQHRPRTRFVAMFAADQDGQTATLFVPPDNNLVASSTVSYSQRFATPDAGTAVPTATLNTLLQQAQIDRLDFLSMDIELAEPAALKGFDVERFKPALVCIEALPEVRQAILDYFHGHGYVVVSKYLRADTRNLYFTPAR